MAAAQPHRPDPAKPVFARSWFERLGVRNVFGSIADRGRRFAALPSSAAPPLQRAQWLADALIAGAGEASGAALARELHAALNTLDARGRLAFYVHLATGFAPDDEKLRHAAQTYLAETSPEAAARLAEAAEPPRQEVLRRMNYSPGGTAMLVAMRKEILAELKTHPGLAPLEADLRHLLASWFNRGFLELRRIDWNTPAAVLDRLIAYEAVHEIQGWEDLHRRLGWDRRCFGFFHPALPGEPLVFVEVALVKGLAGSVQNLLARDPGEAAQRAAAEASDSAIFYSISNCQAGLRGISFGNFLIKQVVEELRAELPHLKQFATLSPIPGFRPWLEAQFAASGDASGEASGEAPEGLCAEDIATLRLPNWWESEAGRALQTPLLRLCARYLNSTAPGRGPLDAVARFHLGNGARMERLNWLANPSPRGLGESYGIMVNYVYDIASIEANHEAFMREGRIAQGPDITALRREAAPKRRRFGLVNLV